MARDPPLDAPALIAGWRTSNRVTEYLIRQLPQRLWPAAVPGTTRTTIRSIAAHLHNSRCSWIRALGGRHGVPPPARVDRRRVSRAELLRALSASSRGIIRLIELGASRGGRVPRSTWQNFPTDLVHFLSYFVAHEAHHRGQLVMLARQLGTPLSRDVAGGLWQWNKRAKE